MSTSTAPDGRTARRERTRRQVVEAFEELLREEDRAPTAERVAERAGVSTRSVFGHFTSLDDLFAEVAARARVRVLELVQPIDPAAPLDERLREIARQRALVNEELGPLRRAAARQAGRSPLIDRVRADRDAASRAQVERVLADRLRGLRGSARARTVATVDALLSGETWDVLRGAGTLTPSEAELAVAEALSRLLGVEGRADR